MNSNRVWIYQSNKAFDTKTETKLKTDIQNFLLGWNAHGKSLTASFEITHHHFIIIKANEAECIASGCSIDKQVQFVKELEKKYSISLLNRLLVAYKEENGIAIVHSTKIPQLLTEGHITKNTLVFNIAVSNEDELETSFEKPLRETWLSKHLLKQ